MNDLAGPPGTPAQYFRQWPIYAGIALAGIAIVTIFFVIEPPAKIDENLCPVGRKPTRQTILFLDTSDPLTPKHHAELERLVTELQQPGVNPDTEDFYVAPGEALIVYKLALSWHNLQPFMEVCNPGDNPNDWDWKKDLTRGKAFALRNWKRFEDQIKELFPEEPEAEMPRSPILENLAVIVPRHAPSKRNLSSEKLHHTHIILFSDLLQHSDLLSHYGPYPKANEFLDTPGLRELATDLTRVNVTIFRLERSRYARWQTRDHYYWWTELVREFGGSVRWQQSL